MLEYKKGTCHTKLQKKDIHQVSTCCTTCPITPQNKASNYDLPCRIYNIKTKSCVRKYLWR